VCFTSGRIADRPIGLGSRLSVNALLEAQLIELGSRLIMHA
jgi:hypothetical protein